MIPGFYPPRRHHRARMAIRLWWHRQQRPTPASASRIVAVVRPYPTPTLALIVAGWAVGMAFLAALATGYTGEGLAGLLVVGLPVWAWCDYRAFRERFGAG